MPDDKLSRYGDYAVMAVIALTAILFALGVIQ